MIRKELPVFLVVGTLTVVVDFLVYHALLQWLGLPANAAKAIGFIAGTAFAYVVNRLWTFGHVTHAASSHWRFMALYTFTLGANVAINGALLRHPPLQGFVVQVAFLVATGASAVLNFVGMKFFVFRTPTAGEPRCD